MCTLCIDRLRSIKREICGHFHSISSCWNVYMCSVCIIRCDDMTEGNECMAEFWTQWMKASALEDEENSLCAGWSYMLNRMKKRKKTIHTGEQFSAWAYARLSSSSSQLSSSSSSSFDIKTRIKNYKKVEMNSIALHISQDIRTWSHQVKGIVWLHSEWQFNVPYASIRRPQ